MPAAQKQTQHYNGFDNDYGVIEMDKQGFTLLVKEYNGMVRAAILKVIPSLGYGQDLDDLTQEAWAKAWERRDKFDPEKAQIQTWLHRQATDVSIAHLREQAAQKRPTLVLPGSTEAVDIDGAGMGIMPYYEQAPAINSHGSDAMPPHAPGADEVASRDEVAADIVKKFDELGQRERDILSLAYDEDLSAREIAATLGLEYDNVRQIMARSRKFVTGR